MCTREAIKTRIAAYLTRTEQLKAVLCGSSTKRTTPAAAANAPRTAAQAQAQLSKYFSRVGGDDTDAVTWKYVASALVGALLGTPGVTVLACSLAAMWAGLQAPKTCLMKL